MMSAVATAAEALPPAILRGNRRRLEKGKSHGVECATIFPEPVRGQRCSREVLGLGIEFRQLPTEDPSKEI